MKRVPAISHADVLSALSNEISLTHDISFRKIELFHFGIINIHLRFTSVSPWFY